MAMAVRQNKDDPGIGGHISTYASLATLVEVGFHHFFHAQYGDQPGDLVYFQGHASPGIYAHAFLEGRLSEEHLRNFRHELRDQPGLPFIPASVPDARLLVLSHGFEPPDHHNQDRPQERIRHVGRRPDHEVASHGLNMRRQD